MAVRKIMKSLEKYAGRITEHYCKGCGINLDTSAGNILMYTHKDGWVVDGMDSKQWLYIKCQKCGYDWALWKLGVSR